MKKTKKQHYIPKKLLEIFISGEKIYEYLVNSKKIYPTNINNAMCERNIYEHVDLNENLIENILARKIDGYLPIILRKILININDDDVTSVYKTICDNIYYFLICYFRSGAIITELRTGMKTNVENRKIEKFLSIIGDKYYILSLAETIKLGYNFAIIKSENDNFLISDQYISTCSLKPKGLFANVSNRNIGIKNTMILIPITSTYYIVFYNGSNDLNLKNNIINILSKENTNIINNVIFNNSYHKVAFKNISDLNDIDKKHYSMSPITCISKYESGKTAGIVTKKEVFLLPIYQEAFKTYRELKFIDKINTSRNEKCPCESGKKFKFCCMEKYNIVKEMYTNLNPETHGDLPISKKLCVEKSISLISNDYKYITDLAKKNSKNN